MNFRKIIRHRRDETYKTYQNCTIPQRFVWLTKQYMSPQARKQMLLIAKLCMVRDLQAMKGFKHD